jgi:hypothetical protein
MDASFHGGSNDTIGGRVRPRQPRPTPAAGEIAVFSLLSLTPANKFSAVSLTPANRESCQY